MSEFAPLLGLLADVPDPRRAQGQIYKLPHVLLFSILAIVTGGNSYRGIVTFIDINRRKLNAAFGLKWRRAPAHTAIRYILKGLDPAAVEAVFRRHAARLQAARATPGPGSIALDGKTLRGSFDNFNDRAAAQVLSAFATETAFYVANTPLTAARAAEAVRVHWRIETTSHYSRDITFGEDRSRIRFNPNVFARLRSFAFNILKAKRSGTLSQDRYRAALAGVDNLLRLLVIP